MSTAEGPVPRILLWPCQVAVCGSVGEDAMKTTSEIGKFRRALLGTLLKDAEHRCWVPCRQPGLASGG